MAEAVKIAVVAYIVFELYQFITGSEHGLINWILDKLGI